MLTFQTPTKLMTNSQHLTPNKYLPIFDTNAILIAHRETADSHEFGNFVQTLPTILAISCTALSKP
jgi:hypothetical protein